MRTGIGIGITLPWKSGRGFSPASIGGLSCWYDPSDTNYRANEAPAPNRFTHLLNKVDTNINKDPLFVNAGAGDFKLQAASPCRGVGPSIPSLIEDFEGNAIPSATGPDMGCYET